MGGVAAKEGKLNDDGGKRKPRYSEREGDETLGVVSRTEVAGAGLDRRSRTGGLAAPTWCFEILNLNEGIECAQCLRLWNYTNCAGPGICKAIASGQHVPSELKSSTGDRDYMPSDMWSRMEQWRNSTGPAIFSACVSCRKH